MIDSAGTGCDFEIASCFHRPCSKWPIHRPMKAKLSVGTPSRLRSTSQRSMTAVAPMPISTMKGRSCSNVFMAFTLGLTIQVDEGTLRVQVDLKSRGSAHGHRRSVEAFRGTCLDVALLRRKRLDRVKRAPGIAAPLCPGCAGPVGADRPGASRRLLARRDQVDVRATAQSEHRPQDACG